MINQGSTKSTVYNSSQFPSMEQELVSKIDADEVVALLQALIQAKSDYPPGDCREAIQIVLNKLQEVDLSGEIFSRSELQPNLVVSIPSQNAKPCLLYHAHIDTVPTGETERWEFDPFKGEIHNGRIFGRGAGDDKSSVAAQIMALITLARAGIDLDGQLQVAIVADEESGGLNGTHWMHQEGILQPDALVVGEQTNNQIAVAERVACGIDLTVFGKSAHGAMPWEGENAVLKAAGALTWLRENYFPKLADRKHPYLPPPTLNIGKITGGIQWSIVPERCKIEMDRRLLPGETREMAMDELREALDTYAQQVESLNYKLFSTGEVAANINTPADDPFVILSNQTLTAVTGAETPLFGYPQTSDGRWFAKDGIPIIIFGPSDPAVAHSTDEYVEIDQLFEATKFLTLLAARYLSPANLG